MGDGKCLLKFLGKGVIALEMLLILLPLMLLSTGLRSVVTGDGC